MPCRHGAVDAAGVKRAVELQNVILKGARVRWKHNLHPLHASGGLIGIYLKPLYLSFYLPERCIFSCFVEVNQSLAIRVVC